MKLCERCNRSLGYPGTDWIPLLCPSCAVPLDRLQAPTNAPDFEDLEILAAIGQGGMGQVLLGRENQLRRIVAVKLMSGRADAERMARFRREAEIAAALHHKSILPVYSFREISDVIYYTMPYIAGPTLQQVVEWSREIQNPADLWTHILSPGNAGSTSSSHSGIGVEILDERNAALHLICRRFADLAEGLYAVHRAGLLHRDIKPGNILVSPEGELLLMDFGLVRVDGSSQLTTPNQLLGSPYYMSPEQVSGRIELDQRSDVYSLGVCLYVALTGQRPFDGPDVETVLRKITTSPPLRPREINRSFPVDLEAVVLQAMAKDADERYPTPRALAADLQRFIHLEPVTARPRVLRSHARLFIKRHRRALAAILLIFCVGFSALGFWVDRSRRLQAEASLTIQQLTGHAREQLQRAQESSDWSVRYALESMTTESNLWDQLAGEHLLEAQRSAESAHELDPEDATIDRLRREVAITSLLQRSALARVRGHEAEADELMNQARVEARDDEMLASLCRAAGRSASLEVIASNDIVAVDLIAVDEESGAKRVIALTLDRENALPPEGTWRLQARDRSGGVLESAVWIAPARSRRQLIEIPISATRMKSDHPDMVLVPGSICVLGSDWDLASSGQYGERRDHVAPFLISRFEVTNAEYLRFVTDREGFEREIAAARLERPDYQDMADRRPLLPLSWTDGRPPEGSDRMPVMGVSLIEAMAYARWRDARLPTDDEWEKAARGGTDDLYPGGRGLPGSGDQKYIGILPVGARGDSDRSGYGVHDLFANAAEWIDGYVVDDEGTRRIKSPVTRGYFDTGYMALSRFSHRAPNKRPFVLRPMGIRLARDLVDRR